MRTVTYGAACSLDGFIAGADGSIDWLHFSKDVSAIMRKSMSGVDTMLMGRKTWEDAVARGGGGGGGGGSPYDAVTTFVFSRTLTQIDAPGVQLVSEDAGEFVRGLKALDGKGKICVLGGGLLATSLFDAGVIDEIGINIHPILLGSGVPLFGDARRRIKLELTECRAIDGGCVMAEYHVIEGTKDTHRKKKR